MTAPIRATWSLCVPEFWPKGPNDLSGRHKQVIARERTRCRDAVVAANGNQPVPRFAGRPVVQVFRMMGKGQRPLDADNAMSAIKPLIDVLRDHVGKKGQTLGLGLFPDDRTKDIDLRPVIQRRSPDKKPWTRILVAGELQAGIVVYHGEGSQLELDVLPVAEE